MTEVPTAQWGIPRREFYVRSNQLLWPMTKICVTFSKEGVFGMDFQSYWCLMGKKTPLFVEPFLCIIILPTTFSNHPRFHLSADSFRECVCSAWSCWGGISICVWIAVWALERKIGQYALPPGLRSLLWLLIWLPSGTQPLAPCWLLRILHAIYKLASSCL